jgi:tRNA G18 (ribose-2'-O)-methylase SpoU
VGHDVEWVVDPGDPRLDGYRRLANAHYRAGYEREAAVFVAEGRLAAFRLASSAYRMLSLVVTSDRLQPDAGLVRAARAAGAEVFATERDVIDAAAGYPVHRGVLALGGRRPAVPATDLLRRPGLVLVAEGVNDGENMGSLLRNAAAFGVGAVVLDPSCCDPLSRRSVRVSVGHALQMPLGRAATWAADLVAAVDSGVAVVALTPAPGAPPLDRVMAAVAARHRATVALLVGAEGRGLSPAALAASPVHARIPMQPGVDSLNVAAATAVALYEARRCLGAAGG